MPVVSRTLEKQNETERVTFRENGRRRERIRG